MIAYYNNEFMEKDAVKISPDDRGFLFGDSLYEAARAYPKGLFRFGDHIHRLNTGAGHMQLSCTDFSHLEDVANELLRQNNLQGRHALVYFQVTRGAAPRNHPFPVPAPDLTVYGFAKPVDDGEIQQKTARGIKAVTVPDIRWARCDMKTTGLAANVLASQQAVEQGAAEAVFVRDGVMMEGSHTNFFAVKDGTLITAPLSNYILPGITRKVVLELSEQLGISVSLFPLMARDADHVSEMMVTGTTKEVCPIVELNGKQVGDGTPGPVAQKLQQAFRQAAGV